MSQNDAELNEITPAHLAFLTIFNPDLAKTEDTEKDQIVFHWSKSQLSRRKTHVYNEHDEKRRAEEDEHERLRQVGLAQGMLHFSR